MHFVYILYSAESNKFYIGESAEPERRLEQHNRGNVPSTQPHQPWVIVWLGEKANRSEALELERKLKNLKSPARLVDFIKKYGKWDYERK